MMLLAACQSGDSAPTPTPAATPASTEAPTATVVPTPTRGPQGSADIGPERFDPARALAHVEALVDVGPRPAGSEAEREAAAYLRDQLAGFGYEAELQPFTFDVFADAGSSLEVVSPGPSVVATYPLEPSANGAAEGRLVDAGIGRPEEFPSDAAGAIALMRRGTLLFSDKVANAAAAGAVAAVIFNDDGGLFAGELVEPSTIPALGISELDGEALLEMLASGPVSVRLEVRTASGPRDSQNVVARPPDGECRVVAGGHYDSVPAGPGANDNASGTATSVEMARVLAADGEFDDVCFVLFGAEEVGLIGSAAFVDGLPDPERDAMAGMLNFDMVSVGNRWLLIGSSALTDPAEDVAEVRGLDFDVTNSDGGGSDHASFINAGIPGIFFHSFFSVPADDPAYHTANDLPDNVRPTRMAEIAAVGLALIDTLLASG